MFSFFGNSAVTGPTYSNVALGSPARVLHIYNGQADLTCPKLGHEPEASKQARKKEGCFCKRHGVQTFVLFARARHLLLPVARLVLWIYAATRAVPESTVQATRDDTSDRVGMADPARVIDQREGSQTNMTTSNASTGDSCRYAAETQMLSVGSV